MRGWFIIACLRLAFVLLAYFLELFLGQNVLTLMSSLSLCPAFLLFLHPPVRLALNLYPLVILALDSYLPILLIFNSLLTIFALTSYPFVFLTLNSGLLNSPYLKFLAVHFP